jgi:hypothetical protein
MTPSSSVKGRIQITADSVAAAFAGMLLARHGLEFVIAELAL